jgi:hypothetical protein
MRIFRSSRFPIQQYIIYFCHKRRYQKTLRQHFEHLPMPKEHTASTPASYPHIGIPGFTRSVYNASHNGYFYRFRDTAKAILHLLGHAYNIYFTAATGWTGDYYGTTLAYA